MHITKRSGTSYNAIVTVSSPLIRSGLISALRYDQKYSFLTTYHHGKVPEKMGNGESCRLVEITYSDILWSNKAGIYIGCNVSMAK